MSTPDRPPSREGGFTLVEMLVALVIVGMILSGLPSLIRLGSRASHLARHFEAAAGDRTALSVIERRLSETMSVSEQVADGSSALAFKGTGRSVTFVAPGSLGQWGSGLFRFDLSLASDDRGLSLGWQLFRPKLDPEDALPSRVQRLAIPNVTSLAIRYYGPPSLESAPVWQRDWPRADELPTLVELALGFGANGSMRRIVVALPH